MSEHERRPDHPADPHPDRPRRRDARLRRSAWPRCKGTRPLDPAPAYGDRASSRRAAAVALIVPTAALASHTGGKPEPAPATQTSVPDRRPRPPTATSRPRACWTSPTCRPAPRPRMDYVTDGRSCTWSTAAPWTSVPSTRSAPSRSWRTGRASGSPPTTRATPYVEVQDADGTFHDPVPSDVRPRGQPAPQHRRLGGAGRPGDGVEAGAARAACRRATRSRRPATARGWGRSGRSDCAARTLHGLSSTSRAAARRGSRGRSPTTATQPLATAATCVRRRPQRGRAQHRLHRDHRLRSCSTLLGRRRVPGLRRPASTRWRRFSPGRPAAPGATRRTSTGIGHGVIAMYDLQGKPAVRPPQRPRRPSPSTRRRSREDDTHVLAPVFQDGKWSLVRFASDGSMEYAVPPAAGADDGATRTCSPTGGAGSPALTPSGHDLGHRQGRVGRQVERGRRAAAGDQLGAERGDHRAVVGAQSGSRDPDPDAPAASARSLAIARSREFAATPPPIRMSSMPWSVAASSALRISTSQTASWKLAATSATSTGAPSRCWVSTQRATAVLSPENEKSKRCRSRSRRLVSPRGKSIVTWPSRAARSMCGPPGNGSPSSRATLSNASPAASSMVGAERRRRPRGDVLDPQQAGVAAADQHRQARLGQRRRARAGRRRRGRRGG